MGKEAAPEAEKELLFTGVPAYVAEVLGPTRVKFSTGESDFDPARRIEIDLARDTTLDPERWATDVDVDAISGLTSIGPAFPNAVDWSGMVYLASRLVERHRDVLASWPPAPDERYQFQTLVRADGSRFHGFKVQVLAAHGPLLELAFVRTGERAPDAASRVRWIDMTDGNVIDSIVHEHTTLDETAQVGAIGAVFVNDSACKNLDLDPGKWPQAAGTMSWEPFPAWASVR